MAGPYCKNCAYFRRLPMDSAECGDPTKIIFSGGGDRVNSPPEVSSNFSCLNHREVKNSPGTEHSDQ